MVSLVINLWRNYGCRRRMIHHEPLGLFVEPNFLFWAHTNFHILNGLLSSYWILTFNEVTGMTLKMMEILLFILPSHMKVFGDGFRYFMYCLYPIASLCDLMLSSTSEKHWVINDRLLLIPTGFDLIWANFICKHL